MRNTKRYSFRILSKEQKITFALIAFLCLLLCYIFLITAMTMKKRQAVSEAENFGRNVSTSITLIISQSVTTTQVLKNSYIDFGEDFEFYFNAIAARLIQDNPEVKSIYFAPDSVLQLAYPPEYISSTVGFHILEDKEQSAAAQAAIDTGNITIAGPHNLVEGGVGVIVRNPIFQGAEFKAFTISVIDWDKFVQKTIETIDTKSNNYFFGVWKEDLSHIVTDEYGFIFKDSDDDIPRDVNIPVAVPGDEWQLSVVPVKGWPTLIDLKYELLLCLLCLISALFFVFYHMCNTALSLSKLKFDALTGLYSRTSFLETIAEIQKTNPNGKYDVIVADIEGFKVINSLYGTELCDKTLKYLAREFSKDNSTAILARYGGDQFIALFDSKTNRGKKEFEITAKKIAERAPIPNINIKYGCYVNIDLSLAANVICDRALMAAKSILRNYDEVVANFNGSISQQVKREHELESAFQEALANEEFEVWTQPKFDALTEKMVGCEALVRWIKKDGTIIRPDEFIHVFEDDGLIVLLDQYVFSKVCQVLHKLRKEGTKIYPVSVNVSRSTLAHKDIISKYAEIVADYDIPIEYVPLEITETTKTDDFEIKSLTEELKKTGFKIHMDDFGTGLSSLESLNILPFDVVKLDKSLVDFIGTPDGNELLRHCIELAHFKNLKVVAEGVESKDQVDFLRSLNCDYIQGYYYAAPMSYEDSLIFFMKMYEQNRT